MVYAEGRGVTECSVNKILEFFPSISKKHWLKRLTV